MNPREVFAWIVTFAVLSGMGTIGVYAMATTPRHAPVPACSLRLGVMRPCYDKTGTIR